MSGLDGGLTLNAIYRLSMDGHGNLTGSGTISQNGDISTPSFTGTYTVAKNCTGTVTTVDNENNTYHFNLVLDDKNAQFAAIKTDLNSNVSGEGHAIGLDSCSLTGVKQVLGTHMKGGLFQLALIDFVGQLTLDGSGGASLSGTTVENGAGGSRLYKGTYTVNSDCTGTVKLKGGGDKINVAYIVADGGKTLLLIDTDDTALIMGNAKQ